MASSAGLGTALRLRRRLRHPDLRSRSLLRRGACEICGRAGEFRPAKVIPDALAETARMTPAIRSALDRRESMCCQHCGQNYRRRQQARAVLELHGRGSCACLTDLLATDAFRARDLLVVDDPILSPLLAAHPRCHVSDYMTSLIPAYGRADSGLPWPDGSFDLVLSQDVLEHTPAYLRAVQEIARVLKPGGSWVTALPLFPERPTLTRATVDETGGVRHLLPPSYHCRSELDSLVFVELGADFLDQVETTGLGLEIYFYSLLGYDYSSIYVCTKARRRS